VSDNLSVWSLISNAGMLVQGVMLLLFLASLVSWWIIARRFLFFRRARHEYADFEHEFWSGVELGQLYKEGNAKLEEGREIGGAESVFRAGFKEFSRLRQQMADDSEAVMEGSERAMRVALSREQDRVDRSLGFLATVGSTSPYIGLFGTVWGIMNAFRGLANVQQATLAVVAPGISEALIATAMGLFAAIPAVIAFNRFSNVSDRLVNRYDTFAEEFSSILHRQAHGRRGERGD
jgi:biopolymer transport protein TolQ